MGTTSERKNQGVSDADVIVMGMGPGGEEVAGRCTDGGLRVLGIERKLVGGECPYWGCVPSKVMVRAADSLAEAARAIGLGRLVADRSRVGEGRGARPGVHR